MVTNDESLKHVPNLGAMTPRDVWNETVVSCRPTSVYCLLSCRNNWQSTYAKRYGGYSSYHPDLNWFTFFAHQKRVKGTAWIIEQLPACAFISQRFSLIVTEVNAPMPLLRYHGVVQFVPGSSLADLAGKFSPGKDNAVICLIGGSLVVPSAMAERKQFDSTSRGGNSTLEWIGPNPAYNSLFSGAVDAICSDYSRQLQEFKQVPDDLSALSDEEEFSPFDSEFPELP
jgi:hypothetical protein